MLNCWRNLQALVESNELPQKPEPVKEEEEPKEEE